MLKDLLVNGFYLFLFCCFVPIILILRNETIDKRKSILAISTSAGIIFCISLPIQLDNGIIFDLRLVAQIFGSLYGGPVVALLLTLVNIGYRSLFEGIGVLTSLVIAPLHLIILVVIRNWYLKLSFNWKIINSILIGICSAITTLFIVHIVGGIRIPLELIIYFSVIQCLILALVIYIVEAIQKLWFVQTKVFQSEKMETVSQLTASISHEIRNPLTSVKGFLQLLQETDLSKSQKNYLEISISELDRAEQVIKDYLAFAKPYSSGEKELLDVSEEINRVGKVLQPLANMNSVHIKLKVKDPLYIEGNQQYFRQCLINICKNAIEAMELHSRGTLSIVATKEGSKAFISIKDTGVGMTKAEIARLGEPYYSTKGTNGTGLGTMFVFNCIQNMGGCIQVTSEKGKGSQFIIQLPLIENNKNIN